MLVADDAPRAYCTTFAKSKSYRSGAGTSPSWLGTTYHWLGNAVPKTSQYGWPFAPSATHHSNSTGPESVRTASRQTSTVQSPGSPLPLVH
jgi:hypothetical protein